MKLVVLLRNPIDRAWSDSLGRTRILRESRFVRGMVRPGAQILLYSTRLQHYFDRFPRAPIHVMLHDDFIQHPAESLRALRSFLSVDPNYPLDMKVKHSSAATPRSRFLNAILWRTVNALQALVPKQRARPGSAFVRRHPQERSRR